MQVAHRSLVEHAQYVEAVVRLMAEQIDMQHDHVQIAVLDSDPPGAEAVPTSTRTGTFVNALASTW